MSWVPFACAVQSPALGLNLTLFSVEPECFNHCSCLSSLQPLWTCLFKTARFTMMLAAISLPMGSCWQPSFPAVKEASLMKEYWLCILWHPTTWARCFTQSDLVSMQQEVRVSGDVRSYLRTQPSVRNAIVWTSVIVVTGSILLAFQPVTNTVLLGRSLWYALDV